MKKILVVLFAVLMCHSIFAQSPNKLSYQAVIRNASNQLVTSHVVGMRISILQGSPTGTEVYSETQTPSTNANGLITIEIGGEAGFDTIHWANGPYFIKTETDPAGLTSYSITGTSQLLSVPYALNAKTAETANYNFLTNLPTLNIANWNTSYGWGNHAAAGYLTSFTETDPFLTTNFDFSGAANNDLLKFNGAKWVKFTPNYSLSGHTHPDVTTMLSGFMSGPDKVKLDGLINLTAGAGININGTNQIVNTAPDQTVSITGNSSTRVSGTYPNFTINSQSATFRWNVFSTYDQAVNWVCGNTASLFCGVSPSSWSDGNALASSISSDKDVLRSFFINKAYAGKNAMVFSDTWYNYSSTNGKLVIALFRIKNNTSSAINWSPCFYYTAYSGWNEYASLSLNGASIWNSGTTGNDCQTMAIPANRVSTVIIVSASGTNLSTRTCCLAFYNDCLMLPAGLEFVDDLDIATGGWSE
jgi:hypothetical protein